MTPEQILSHPPKVLSQELREDYFELGYVKVEGLIPKNTLVELQKCYNSDKIPPLNVYCDTCRWHKQTSNL